MCVCVCVCVCMYSHLICHYTHSAMSSFYTLFNKRHLVISSFRREVAENCALLGCYYYQLPHSSLYINSVFGQQAFFWIL